MTSVSSENGEQSARGRRIPQGRPGPPGFAGGLRTGRAAHGHRAPSGLTSAPRAPPGGRRSPAHGLAGVEAGVVDGHVHAEQGRGGREREEQRGQLGPSRGRRAGGSRRRAWRRRSGRPGRREARSGPACRRGPPRPRRRRPSGSRRTASSSAKCASAISTSGSGAPASFISAGVAAGEHPGVARLEHAAAARAGVDELVRAGAGEHAQLHVGERAGGRGGAVVEVVVAVDEGEPGAAVHPPQGGEDADEDAAAAADHERQLGPLEQAAVRRRGRRSWRRQT